MKWRTLQKALFGYLNNFEIVHDCYECCDSRTEASAKTWAALTSIVFVRVPTPALNKWTSIVPSVCLITLLLRVHDLFLRAFHNVVKHTGAHDSNSDGEIAGHPSDERGSYRKLTGLGGNGSVEYLSASDTAIDLKIWLVTATEAMHLHYYLFKYGKLRGREAMATKMSVMMDIISPEHSRRLRMLERLSFICQPMSVIFRSMCSFLGDCMTSYSTHAPSCS